ncbi:LysE family translocator [bacterium]|nr:LysE family translocator [bacterium]
MSFILFLMQAVIISLSGVMAPGPITAVTVGTGTKSPHAGALVAVGHGIVEFPLMVLVYYGVGHILSMVPVKVAIFSLGGLFLLLMGGDMLRSMKKAGSGPEKRNDAPLVAGILFSMGNVYFLLWWVTVGAALLSKAMAFGIAGVLVFAFVHWSCDFIWLYVLSAVSYKGGNLLGVTFQRIVFGVCGVFLVVFGVKFIVDAVKLWAG